VGNLYWLVIAVEWTDQHLLGTSQEVHRCSPSLLLCFETRVPQRQILHFLTPPVKIRGAVGKILKSLKLSSMVLMHVFDFQYVAVSKPECFKFALFDPVFNLVEGWVKRLSEFFVQAPTTDILLTRRCGTVSEIESGWQKRQRQNINAYQRLVAPGLTTLLWESINIFLSLQHLFLCPWQSCNITYITTGLRDPRPHAFLYRGNNFTSCSVWGASNWYGWQLHLSRSLTSVASLAIRLIS